MPLAQKKLRVRKWQITLLNKSRLRPAAKSIEACLGKVAGDIRSPALPKSLCEISFLWTGNSSIQTLNRKYRGKDNATDVLSFSQIEGDIRTNPPSPLLGDIVISVEKAKSQAKDFSGTLEAEMLRLSIHGMLHLFGYDHEHVSKRAAQRMQRLEDRLFKRHFPAWQRAWKSKAK